MLIFNEMFEILNNTFLESLRAPAKLLVNSAFILF